MTDKDKLDFLLRAIVTAGGPEQTKDMADEVFMLAVSNWILSNVSFVKVETRTSCDCGGKQ